jgi:phytoene desaturase
MNGLMGLRVVIVGAGFGGLSAAAHLRRMGAQVTVVERASRVGGKAAHLEKDGFVFDTGPTLLTMPAYVDEAFRAAGTSLNEAHRVTRLDPVARYVFDNGKSFSVRADIEATQHAIANVFPEDAKAWPRFLAECKEIWEAAGEPYLEAPFDGMFGFSQRVLRRGAKAVKLGMGLGTLDEFARRHFRTKEMIGFVGRFATYAGASPYQASAAFAMIPWLEMAEGAHYPEGGMHALAESLARAVRSRGVEILLSTNVREILVDGQGNASGILTTNPARPKIDADVVLANVDPLTVVRDLLPEPLRKKAGLPALAQRTPSLSGFAWVFGVEGPLPDDAHHSVLFPADYPAEFRAIFQENTVCADPTVYVSVPTLQDSARAPKGGHAVFTLVNAPASAESVDWSREAQRLRSIVLARLEKSFVPNLAPRIRSEAWVTPAEIAATGSVGGAIYGAAPHGPMAPFERPNHRVKGVSGLYFVGGATHPGGGVPLVIRGGRFLAEIVHGDVKARKIRPRSSVELAGGAP